MARAETAAALAGTGRPTLLVVGSCNIDLTARARRLPRPGETVLAHELVQSTGGKGANQAVAAARQGLAVSLVSAVGEDQFGRQILDALQREGVDVTHVRRVRGPSGAALIVIDEQGENTIVVSPGAGAHVTLEGCDLSAPRAVLAQLEIPLEVVCAAAQATTGIFCLNASPYTALPDELVSRCDLIVVNQSEYEQGAAALDAAALVCVTLGARGAKLMREGREIASAPSPRVEAIDSVGAGDAFVATLVGEIMRSGDPVAALAPACRAGALASTRVGAQASLPYREELG